MSLLDNATAILIKNHTPEQSVQPLVVGGEVELDGVSVSLFDIDPQITTREKANQIKEISEYAKNKAGVDWVDWVKQLAFHLGTRPNENIDKLHRYISIKKSISQSLDELEAMS